MTNEQHNTDPLAELRKAMDEGMTTACKLEIASDVAGTDIYTVIVSKTKTTTAQEIAEWVFPYYLTGMRNELMRRIDAALAEREAEQRRKDAEIARTFYAWADSEPRLTTAENIARRIENGGAK